MRNGSPRPYARCRPRSILDVMGAIILVLVGVRADGCVLELASKTCMALMPHERAVIQFRDGKEKLVISCDIYDRCGSSEAGANHKDTNAKEFLWLLPLPNNPREITVGSSLPANMLVPITGPNAFAPRAIDCMALPLLFYIMVFLMWCGLRPRTVLWRRTLILLSGMAVAAVSVPFVLFVVSHRNWVPLLGEGDIALQGCETLQAVETQAMRPTSATELDGMLCAAFGRTLPDGYAQRVNRHISHGGTFCTVKLKPLTEQMGSMADPEMRHSTASVEIEFEAKDPVFPIPLLGEPPCGNVSVDLLVLGDEVFTHDELLLKSAFRCKKESHEVWQLGDERNVPSGRRTTCDVYELVGVRRTVLGFPTLSALLWDGCVITSLTGTLNATETKGDITLYPARRQLPFRAQVGSMRPILLRSALPASLMGLLWTVGVACIWKVAKLNSRRRLRATLALMVFPIIAGVGLACASRFSCAENTVEPWHRNRNTEHFKTILEHLARQPELPKEGSRQSIMQELRESLLPKLPCEAKGTDCYQIFEDERGIVCRVFDVQESEDIEASLRVPAVPAVGQSKPMNYRGRPMLEPWETFLGEPADIVLLDRADPRWPAQ